MVGIACVFDFLDGLVARALNVHSEIGKQLDSLADMVSFGVVPGVMMWEWIKTILVEEKNWPTHQDIIGGFSYFSELFLLPFAGFLITIFSAIRLAKFNLDNRQTDSFIGLPTPANTIFISSLIFLFKSKLPASFHEFLFTPYVLILVTIISSLLLIAPLPLFALKFKNFSWMDNRVRYIFLIFALALLIIYKFVGIPLIIILYIILSIINNIITKKYS